MRIRSLKPDYTTDRITGRWPLDIQMFYAALWTIADDEGRFEWEPDLLRAQLFPYHPALDAAGMLTTIWRAGRVQKYEVDGQHFGVIVNFKRHQHPNKPQPSKLPDPSLGTTVPLPADSRSAPVALPPVEEGRVEEVEGRGYPAEPAAPVQRRERARTAPTGPQADCFAHWRDVIWPKLSGTPYPGTKADHVLVAEKLKQVSPETLRGAMDRYAVDPFWAGKLDLKGFCSHLPKFLTNGSPVAQKRLAIAVPAPHDAFGEGGESGF